MDPLPVYRPVVVAGVNGFRQILVDIGKCQRHALSMTAQLRYPIANLPMATPLIYVSTVGGVLSEDSMRRIQPASGSSHTAIVA